MLERLTTEERAVSRSYSYSSLLGWNYGVVLLLFMMLVLAGIGAFIVPKFEAIFEDFNIALPWQTVKTFIAIRHLAIPILVLVAAAILTVAAWALQQSLHGIEGAAQPLRSVTDRLIWLTPVARSAARDRGLGDACGLMVESLKAGDSIEAAAYQAGELKANIVLRRRLQRFADALQAGKSLRGAAEGARLPKLMVGLLATGQAVSDPARVFDFLARYYANRFSRTAVMLQASVLPGIVLTASLLVGWIVYSVMLPLVVLIEDTTMKVGTF